MQHIINWFEIPATNIERATKFYSHVLSAPLQVLDLGGVKMTFFPFDDSGNISGSLVEHEEYVPSHHATLVYLNANPDLTAMLNRVEEAGGKVLRGKNQISPEYGYMALFEDTEGNRIALHSMQ